MAGVYGTTPPPLNVSQADGSPFSNPFRNQLVRCSRRAVRPRLRVHAAARLALDPVVADRRRRGQALLEVAALEQPLLLRRVPPDAGEAVGLQLEPHRELVRALRVLLLLPVHVVHHAEQVLDVVAELVRDHVGLREVARPPGNGVWSSRKKREVDVDVLVGRAVERARPPRRRRRSPSGSRS